MDGGVTTAKPKRPAAVPAEAAAWCVAKWRRDHHKLGLNKGAVQQVFPELSATDQDTQPISLSVCVPGSPPLPLGGHKLLRSGSHWSISGATALVRSLRLPQHAEQLVLWRDGTSAEVFVAAPGTDGGGPNNAPGGAKPPPASAGSDDELVTDEVPGSTEEDEDEEEADMGGEGQEEEEAVSRPWSAARAGKEVGPEAGTGAGDSRSCKIVAAWELTRQMDVPADMTGDGGVFQRVGKGLQVKRTLHFYLQSGDVGRDETWVELDIGVGRRPKSARLSNFRSLAQALDLQGGDRLHFAPHRDGDPTHFDVEAWRPGPGGRWQRLQPLGPQLGSCAARVGALRAGVAAGTLLSAAGATAVGMEEREAEHPAGSNDELVADEMPGGTEEQEEHNTLGRGLCEAGTASAAAWGVSGHCYSRPLSWGGMPERPAAMQGGGGRLPIVGQGPQIKRLRRSGVVLDVGAEEGGMELDTATGVVPEIPGPNSAPSLALGLETGAGGGAEGRSAPRTSRPPSLAALAPVAVTADLAAASDGAYNGLSAAGSLLEHEGPGTVPASALAVLPRDLTAYDPAVPPVSSLSWRELWELVCGPGPQPLPGGRGSGGGQAIGSSREPAGGPTPMCSLPGSRLQLVGSMGSGEVRTSAVAPPPFASPPQPPAAGPSAAGQAPTAPSRQTAAGLGWRLGPLGQSGHMAAGAPGSHGLELPPQGHRESQTLPQPAPCGRTRQIILVVPVTARMLRKGYLQVQPTFAADFGLAPQPAAGAGVGPASVLSLPLRLQVASSAGSAGGCGGCAAAGGFVDATLSVTPAGPGRKAVGKLLGLGGWMAARGVAEGSVVGVAALQPSGDLSIVLVGDQSEGGVSGEGSDMEVTEDESDVEEAG